jgi:hypothetical protein
MEFTKAIPKIPAALHRSHHAVGHNDKTQQKVRGCHGEDQEVCGRMKLFEM